MYAKNAQKILQRYERGKQIGRWLLVAFFLLTGTVMTFGMHYWEKDISREEALAAEATYQSCRKSYGRGGSLAEILVQFSDLKQQALDSAYASESLYKTINDLEPGTKVSLLLHPNSAMILEFRVGDRVILEFDRAVKTLRWEVIGFTVLGVIVYLCAFGIAAAMLVPNGVGRKLRIIRSVGSVKGKNKAEALRRILRLYFKTLRELLLTGIGFAMVIPLIMLLNGSRGWNVIWLSVLILLVFCLISMRVMVYRIRVWWELRTGKAQSRTIHVHKIQRDSKMCLLRDGMEEKALLIDDAGNTYRFVCTGIGGEGILMVGQKLQISFLPQTGFLLSVVPYLRQGKEKQMKKVLRAIFVLYLNGRYEYESQKRRDL